MYFQSLIIIKQVKDKTSFKDEAYKLIESINQTTPDKNYELEIDIKEGKMSIGVEDIENVVSWNSLKSDSPKICFIFNANFLTKEAQNALLKVVEEPHRFSQIILVTDNKSALLDTVLSRCRIIEIRSEVESKYEEVSDLIKSDYFSKKKEIYDLAQNRNNFISFVENFLNFWLIKSLEDPEWNRETNMIEWIEKWQIALKSSVNTKLVAGSVLLQLSKL